MIAATHFDPVLGVDIHIIQPPGPVPPVPVPHPFVGMVIDPMEYAPIIGGTVMVNGMMRGTAGTGGKGIPPHVPIGGVFVKPPANECEIFMGSQTVTFDGDPASRLGLPVLSCHCVGMPSPPRKKPHTKPKSLELPTTVVMAVPKGAPVLIGGPPTISLMAMAMKFGMAVLGRALKKLRKMQKASKKWKGLSDRMRRAANKMLDKVPGGQKMKNAVSNGICKLTGHPVDVATGKVTTESTDIELLGPLPFRFSRVWYSNSDYAGPLGHGWHHSYDLGLYEFSEGVVVRLPDGRFATFELPTPGEAEFDRTEKLFLRRTADAYEVETLDGLIYSFGWCGKEGEERPLREVRDPNGNRIELVRENNKLTAFIDSGGRRLPVKTDARGRITEIHGPDPDNPGQTFALVTFAYSKEGDLVEVLDALSHPFRYAYGNHLLLKETDRAGLSFYFMYDADGPDAKCLRTWGDGDFFLRDLTYDSVNRRTEVVNSLGHKTIYEWNHAGLVTAETDPLGGVTKTEWGLFNEKLSETNPNGEKSIFEYDDFGRLVCVTDPTGALVAYEYDAAGNQVKFTDPAGHVWTREYDDRRNVVAVTDPPGTVAVFSVDHRGRPVLARDGLGRETRFEWTAAGQLARWVDRAGVVSTFAYDLLGRVRERTDGVGLTRYEYDRRGLRTATVDPAGRRYEVGYNADGDPRRASDPLGRVTELDHGLIGRRLAVRTAGGVQTLYRYDTEGRLVGVDGPGPERWEYSRDANGNVTEERTPDGRVLRYRYDPAGRLMESTNARGQKQTFARDPAGRVTARRTEGAEEVFAYDPSGRMTRAANAAADVRWAYDPLGRVRAETLNGGVVGHRYDPLGNRVARSSPLGTEWGFEFDPEGRLNGLRAGETSLFRSRLDDGGQEVRRESGGCVWEWDRGTHGLPAEVRVRGRESVHRTYAYDPTDTPAGQADSRFGEERYSHDADGRLVAIRRGEESREFRYDTGGNLRPQEGVRHRRDADGNVIEKRDGDRVWRFEYDPFGRLTAAEGDGVRSAYAYDPLGRRVRKTVGGQTTHYLWDGDVLLGHRGAEGTTEYVFRPGTFEPVAVRTSAGVGLIECDPVGLPRSAFNPEGEKVWHASFEPFGRVRAEDGAAGLVGVRYPGQLADPETGLSYNWHRYLDPDVGSYLSPDPVGYYVGGSVWDYVPSPYCWADPLGLERGLWELGPMSSETKVIGNRTYHKHSSTGLWWSRDTAGHGGSAFKVFTEGPGGTLNWYRDADQYGDFIDPAKKHKGPKGKKVCG